MKTDSRDGAISTGLPQQQVFWSSCVRTAPAGCGQPIVYRRLPGPARLRGWAAGKPVARPEALPAKSLVAKLADGPLDGCTREVAAIEGRPPKTIDLEWGDRTVRYCLAEWEQSGHAADYGFLYEV